MSQEKLKEAMAEFDRLAEMVIDLPLSIRHSFFFFLPSSSLSACLLEVQTNHRNTTRLATQQNENEAVIRELEAAAADAVIYKMVGPVLIRQNKAEALSTVNKRLEYVKGELQRCDKIDLETRKQFQEAAQNVEAVQKKLLDKQRQQKGRL
ncbi:hypothetical protein Efla_006777 [Eimeria flavescens]